MLAAHAVDRSVLGTASNGASSGCGNKAQLRRHDSSAGRIWGWCTRAAQWSSGMSMVIDCSIDHRQQLVRLSLVEAGRQGSLMLTDRANQLSSLCQPTAARPKSRHVKTSDGPCRTLPLGSPIVSPALITCNHAALST
jgi:hypothetical protein